jgi:hypothetical protein
MGFTRPLLIVSLAALPPTAHALRFSIAPIVPFVYIQVGHGALSAYGLLGPPAGQVDEVVFTLPTGTQAGDGTPIVGTPMIPIAFLGYSGSNRANYRVTMNSAAGLVNAAGDRIPFSDFSWTTRDGDIPAGQFNDSANQLLQQYSFHGNRARGVVDYLTFSYANDAVPPGGTYTGRVVYTITEL